MARLLVPASLIAAILGISPLAIHSLGAVEQAPGTYLEATSDSNTIQAGSDDESVGDRVANDESAAEPAASSETDLGEPNPIGEEDEKAGKLAAAPADEPVLEVIRERYPNRAVKIERSVTQDANGNYVNEGLWRMWDQKGILVAEGKYCNGVREGIWNRWYRAGDAELLTKPPYNGFTGPFISQATFVNGKLNGSWTIYDGKQRKISQWDFVDGQRDGRFTWWFPTGRKMREIEFVEGEIDGQLIEWSIEGKVVTKETFQRGRKLAIRVEKDPAGEKKTEGQYLFAKEVEKTPDDWWNAQLATFVKQGKDERHGPWISWYPKGQRHSEGEFRNDVQVGNFTWWYSNGQKALEGGYADGEQQGKWVWWHQNGQKAIQGEYTKGHPSGHWTWWNEDGKVARSTDMENGAGEVVRMPEKPQSRSAARPTMPNHQPLR